MTFIKTIKPNESEGEVRDMYEHQQNSWGFVPNYAKVFCYRPKVMERWGRLLAEIRRPMDDRRFELATFAAAHELKHTPCTIQHGKMLADLSDSQAVLDLAHGNAGSEFSAAELAIANFARKVARDASEITSEDVALLKQHGIDDAEIFDIAAAAAGRAFFTKLLDALGVEADALAVGQENQFTEPLTVGRPVGTQPPEYIDR